MKKVPLILSGLFISQVLVSSATERIAGNSIKLLALNQPPCTTLSPQSVVKAKVLYQLAAEEQSEKGFEVSIKFQGVDPRLTFSRSSLGRAAVTNRTDTLTLTYPMAAILGDSRLRRPITCYFYLHRNTGEGRSIVLAKTDAVVFQECQ